MSRPLLYVARFPLAPPSLNNLFPSVGRKRVPSRQYAKWLKQMALFFPAADTINQRVSVSITIADKVSKADIDNLVKPVLDMLVRRRILATDSKRVVRCVHVVYDDVTECQVVVRRYVDGSDDATGRDPSGDEARG